jgi:hypothetical protein
MSDRGIQLTDYTKGYRFTKDELKVLYGIQGQLITLQKEMQRFIVKKVCPRFNLKDKVKYEIKYDITKNWIKFREKVRGAVVTPGNWHDVLKISNKDF